MSWFNSVFGITVVATQKYSRYLLSHWDSDENIQERLTLTKPSTRYLCRFSSDAGCRRWSSRGRLVPWAWANVAGSDGNNLLTCNQSWLWLGRPRSAVMQAERRHVCTLSQLMFALCAHFSTGVPTAPTPSPRRPPPPSDIAPACHWSCMLCSALIIAVHKVKSREWRTVLLFDRDEAKISKPGVKEMGR